jgi:hypothetical protein
MVEVKEYKGVSALFVPLCNYSISPTCEYARLL